MRTINFENIRGDIRDLWVAAGDIRYYMPSPDREREQLNIARLVAIKNMRAIRIDGFMKSALGKNTYINIEMEFRPEFVPKSWTMISEPYKPYPRNVSPGETIVDAFDGRGRALLILGEPGSGKTVTLLKLTSILLDRAEKTPDSPLPLFLDLSTWPAHQPPFRDWLLEELNEIYQIPKRIGQKWIDSEQICLLLDGLDDVHDVDGRNACVTALNEFRQHHAVDIAVTCRALEYGALSDQLNVSDAVMMKDLEDHQVTEYLDRIAELNSEIRLLLESDFKLRKIARRPLFLATLAYAHEDVDRPTLLRMNSIEDRHTYLMATFVRHRLECSKWKADYSRGQALCWLGWLAEQMKRHGKKIFITDYMQPSWLSSPSQITSYSVLTRTLISLISFSGIAWSITPLLFSLANGISLGFMDSHRLKKNIKIEKFKEGRNETRSNMLRVGAIVVATTSALVTMALLALTPISLTLLKLSGVISTEDIDISNMAETANFVLGFMIGQALSGCFMGILVGVIYSLPLVGIFGRTNPGLRRQLDVEAIESLGWSWPGSARGMISGFLAGLVSAIVGYLPWCIVWFYYVNEGLIFQPLLRDYFNLSVVTGAGTWMMIGILIGGLVGGIRGTVYIPSDKTHGSLITTLKLNANLGGLIVGCLGGFLAGLGFGFSITTTGWLMLSTLFGPSYGAIYALALGVPSAMLFTLFLVPILAPTAWLIYGGSNLIKAKVVRWLLRRKKTIPLHLEEFLDHMCDIALLNRIGGGYGFTHDYLRDYLASQLRTEPSLWHPEN